MSNPVGAQRYGLGGGDAYYDAVKYGGYTGTREQFGRDQAEFAENATAVAEAKEEVERNTQTVVNTAQTFTEETVPAAIQSVEEKGDTEEDRLELRTTELVEAVNTAGTVQVQAVRDEGTTQTRLISGAGTAQVEAVEQAGSDQVDAVELAGSTQVENVNSAGTTQVGNVNSAGTIQVGNVNTAGDDQVQAVQEKGTEVINSIPADYTALNTKVNNLEGAVLNFADILVDTQKGVNSDSGLVLLPVKQGDSITIKPSDGNPFSQTDQLCFYDVNGTYIDYWSVSTGYGSSRTFTYNKTTPAEYIGITKVGNNVINYDIVNNTSKSLSTQLDEQKASYSTFIKSIWHVNVYKGEIVSSSGKLMPFYAKDNDSITIISTDRSDFVDVHVRFYDIDGNYINYYRVSTTNGNSRTIIYNLHTEAYYVGITTVDITSPNEYTIINNSNVYKTGDTIVVDYNGTGDYTSLTQALYENTDVDLTIRVLPGVYNIIDEYVDLFGQTAVDNMSDSDSSIFKGFQYGAILRNKRIIFESGSFVVCDRTGYTVDGTHRFSALRVDYNVEIIGLDLDCTGTFYAIHDDYGANTPYTVKYKNCRVIGHNLTNVNCIGGGCRSHSTHIIEDCYFDNNTISSTVVRYHNTNAEGATPKLFISNSYFSTNLLFNWYGTQTSKMKAYVNNCHARSINKSQESSSYTVDNIELYKWNNEESGQ